MVFLEEEYHSFTHLIVYEVLSHGIPAMLDIFLSGHSKEHRHLCESFWRMGDDVGLSASLLEI